MLHAFAALLFSVLALAALGVIALLLRADWDAVTTALGVGAKAAGDPSPLPPKISVRQGRRATMIRLESTGSRWRAAA